MDTSTLYMTEVLVYSLRRIFVLFGYVVGCATYVALVNHLHSPRLIRTVVPCCLLTKHHPTYLRYNDNSGEQPTEDANAPSARKPRFNFHFLDWRMSDE